MKIDGGRQTDKVSYRGAPILKIYNTRFNDSMFFTLILSLGLAIRVKLLRSLPNRFKVTVQIRPGTHASELAVNKQVEDLAAVP